MKWTLAFLSVLFVSLCFAEAPKGNTIKKPSDDVFFIFKDRGSRLNHYIPSGWMGDYGDLKMNTGYHDTPGPARVQTKTVNDNTCIQIKYSAQRAQGGGWAGIYWQQPANNWGDKKGGMNLSNYKSLTFWMRGEKGGEYIDKAMMGGISGISEDGDSDSASVEPIELTKEWKEYTIDLRNIDPSYIVGGFCFVLNADMNPEGATFYVDEIKYEK